MLSSLHKHIFVQFCISKSLYKISSYAKLHTSFCYQCVQVPSFAPLCAELLVQFVYQCKLPYRSVLSALFRCRMASEMVNWPTERVTRECRSSIHVD